MGYHNYSSRLTTTQKGRMNNWIFIFCGDSAIGVNWGTGSPVFRWTLNMNCFILLLGRTSRVQRTSYLLHMWEAQHYTAACCRSARRFVAEIHRKAASSTFSSINYSNKLTGCTELRRVEQLTFE